MSVSLRQPVPPTGTARAALPPNKWPFAVLMISAAGESMRTSLGQRQQTNFEVRHCSITFPRRLFIRGTKGQYRSSITLFARLQRSVIPRPTHARVCRHLVPCVLGTGDWLKTAGRSR